MKSLLAVLALISLSTGLAATDPLIKLQKITFDPTKRNLTTASAEPQSERAPDGKGHYLLQFSGPILEEWLTAAQAAGAEILDYIPDFAYVVRAGSSAETRLRALPSVRWIGDYRPSWRISPRLSGNDADVVIRTFPGSDAAALRNRISGLGGSHDSGGPEANIRAHIPGKVLAAIARTAGVAWIEPKPHYKLSNNVARGIANANTVWSNVGLFGAGQVVAMADTGLDTGNLSTVSLDFRGRVTATYSLGRTNDWSDGTSNGGHGTHVSGSVLGNGTLSGSNAANHSYVGSFAGVAPEASLVFQSIMDSSGNLGGLPTNLSNLFSTPYASNNARVHSNSWGDNSDLGAYTGDSSSTDSFVWGHKDMVICFAAGNSGRDINNDGLVDPGSIESPSTAKDCISVGASESLVLSGGAQITYGSQSWDLTAAPIGGDLVSNNASGMAGFSSRGPTTDGRIKPDICAPGTNIISARSHASGAGTLWGAYNSDYTYSGGTSMATPIVAGACALVQEWYIKQKGIAAPSAALVKATLLNGAFDMTPGQYPVPPGPREIGTRPNTVEGWGRLDLKNSIMPGASRFIFPTDDNTGLRTGSSSSYSYYVSPSNEPLKVTLAWSDYQASAQASKALVNDLDLTVTAPGGQIYYGNDTGSHTADRKNNVEGIDIPAAVPGLYTVTVTAYNVAKPNGSRVQPYALIAAGPVTSTAPTAVSTISALKALADGALVTLTAKNVSAGSDQLANCFYIEDPDRTSGIKVHYGSGGGPVISEGRTVTVTGAVATTADGERVIQNPILSY